MNRDDLYAALFTLVLVAGIIAVMAVSFIGGRQSAKDEQNAEIIQLRDSIKELRIELLERAVYE